MPSTHFRRRFASLCALALVLTATLVPATSTATADYCDLTGDGVFNLADIGVFGDTFINGPYDPRMDFNDDAAINMIDLAMLSDCLNP